MPMQILEESHNKIKISAHNNHKKNLHHILYGLNISIQTV